MNPRTVKKLKCELEASLSFCAQLHNLARSIILDVDPRQRPFLPPPLIFEGDRPSTTFPSASLVPPAARPSAPPAPAPAPASLEVSASLPVSSKSNNTVGTQSGQTKNDANRNSMAMKTTVSPGNAEGSTLRKSRKKKLPPNTEPPPNVPEFDNAGRRLVSKAEHNIRVFEMLRFRALRQGDFVAARTTSRDLWILARVLKDYPTHDVPPLEFLQLSETRRDALFREKVHVKDVEEKDGDNAFQVPRNLVLPLPRTYAEAAEWGQRIKKGMRLYSMYPNTTSLYPATVIDSTTYCRGDDDIVVVEFDGEEPDETGTIPKYHIPARFVTLIPKEFPSSQPPTVTSGNKNNKRKSSSATHSPDHRTRQKKASTTDDLMDFGDFDGNFDALDLDFDKPIAADDDDDGGFPPLL